MNLEGWIVRIQDGMKLGSIQIAYVHPKSIPKSNPIQMMRRFTTFGACETICAEPGLGEYSLGECSQSELSLKKGVNVASSP